MIERHALTEYQWERIAPLLPGKIGDVGVTAKDNRWFVEAVLYRYRTGIPWARPSRPLWPFPSSSYPLQPLGPVRRLGVCFQ